MLIAILTGALLVHAPNGWVFSATGGGWEFDAFLIRASGVLILLCGGLAPSLPPLLQLERLN